MASGSSGRANSGSKGFDFASDDILCSYEDYGNQDSPNGGHSEPVISSSSGKDFHNTRRGRSVFTGAAYTQPEDSFNQDVISAVEKSMKRNADNLMRFLEGISSRLSQLELYCYNLDKSIGEMRSDLIRDHGEADSKLKAIDKHLQEVHRSIQILRDKQELADTQKELAKLQLVQKESSSSSHQSTEDRASPPTSDSKKNDNTSDTHNQQLALALPHQVAPSQQPVAPPVQPPPQNVSQQPPYYLPAPQLPNPPAPAQHPHRQYVASDPQYRTPQLQDIPRVAPQPTQSQVNQTPPVQQFPQYQQQLSQQLPQQVQLPQQPSVRPPSPVYPSYAPSQPTNPPPPPETLPNSMPMQVPYSGIPQAGTSLGDAVPFGYTAPGRAAPQQLPPQQMKGAYAAQPGDGYAASGPHPAFPPGSTYMMYDSDGGRAHYPPQVPHFAQGGYPPTSASLPNQLPNVAPNVMVRNPQFMRNHPYAELIEKLASMGFRGDHIVSVIQRMEESGQPIDFNGVLDRLNVHSSGAPQRGWSG
ncbi:hypothetical protein L484_009824 [Morus notabilis]|uniref:DUF1421 domain-containing protein n=1 Tax=Morus notabilis TaxID=981085 RepID=W9STD6_9ROSA|nr:extensin [Morus notabilis]EXC25515.1 hypothetical protein L484_009824 [Morus notabilis]